VTDLPRVLVVTNLWPRDGSYRGVFVEEQVQALRRLGYPVDVEVVAQARGRADYLGAVPRVRRRARTGGYDLVHIHYGLTALAARYAGPVPRVLTLHGSDVRVPWQALATRLGSGGVVARIYVSAHLAERAGDPAGIVIPGGVDFTLFQPQDRGQARARLGLPPDVPVALFGGRPDLALKRYDLFQAVLRELGERGLTTTGLVLAEPGQARADVPLKFAAADVLLMTSAREGSPTVVKEAAVMGLPVVSTDVGDVRQILDRVRPSAVVTGPDLARALADAAEPVLRHPTRSNGRQHCAWLDSVRVAERVGQVYQQVLNRA